MYGKWHLGVHTLTFSRTVDLVEQRKDPLRYTRQADMVPAITPISGASPQAGISGSHKLARLSELDSV